jgi:two-component system, chemotaxis family, protein-glutamate methylesterase/glutaminase
VARIVVIGGSQGGVQALRTVLAGLPAGFPVPLLVVQHIGAMESVLPAILSDAGALDAAFAAHGELLEPGRIYVAPPDHHMLVNDGVVELSRGPRENWARPAVDPLFRSAARFHGPDVIGVLLSGRLNDGTAGLYEIKRQGGIAMVQTPREAQAPDMPQSALDNVPVDYCLPIAEMPRLLIRLANEPPSQRPFLGGVPAGPEPLWEIIRPSAQTCPECGGALEEESLGSLTRFRCHTGHVMTAEVLAATRLEDLEASIASLLRRLNERVGLCHEIAAKHQARGDARSAELWQHAAEEALRREKTAREMARLEWAHPEVAENAEAEA